MASNNSLTILEPHPNMEVDVILASVDPNVDSLLSGLQRINFCITVSKSFRFPLLRSKELLI